VGRGLWIKPLLPEVGAKIFYVGGRGERKENTLRKSIEKG